MGSFSAFDKKETINLDMLKEEPYADGNPGFGLKHRQFSTLKQL